MNLSLLAILLSLSMLTPILAVRAAEAPKPVRNVSVEEFDQLRNDKKSVVLDVRTKKEFASGHLPGALNIDWNGPDFAKEAARLDPGKTYLVHCAVGKRSASACAAMSGKLGLTNCLNLEGGLSAWQKAGKPLQK